MSWFFAILKVLAILAVYGGLVLALERRTLSRGPLGDGQRQLEPLNKNKARRSRRVA
jgi:hypothetical protein